jgi:hypothetical protein
MTRISKLEMEVVWPVPAGTAAFIPGTMGFTMVCFTAEQVPSNTKVYTEHQVREMLAQRGRAFIPTCGIIN